MGAKRSRCRVAIYSCKWLSCIVVARDPRTSNVVLRVLVWVFYSIHFLMMVWGWVEIDIFVAMTVSWPVLNAPLVVPFRWKKGGILPGKASLQTERGSRALHCACVISSLSNSVAWDGTTSLQRRPIPFPAMPFPRDFTHGLPRRTPPFPPECGRRWGV